MRQSLRWMWAFLLLSSWMAGCGDDDSSDSHGYVGQTSSQRIVAADGGVFDALGAKLVVPPGALTEDTEITLKVEDRSVAGGAALASDVYNYGPDGLEFAAPATLTLPFRAGGVPSGSTATLSVYEAGEWKPLADSTVSGGAISAKATHFSRFAVVVTGGAQTGGGCDALEFTPCGGDLTGTWSFSAACMTLTSPPQIPQCPQAVVTYDADFTGTVTFAENGDFSSSVQRVVQTYTRFPKTCLPPGKSCDFAGENVQDEGSECVKIESHSDSSTDAGTWSSAGTTVTIERPDDAPESQQYCVNGDRASVRVEDPSKNTVIIYELQR